MMEEMIDIIDENDNVIDVKPRSYVRKNALPFRAVRVIVKNLEGKLLVQKRSARKDFYPGLWELGVAGTVASGEDYEETALRELAEEEGIKNCKIHFLFDLKIRSDIDRARYKVYECAFNGRLAPQDSEVEMIMLASFEDINELIKKEAFTPPLTMAFQKYMEGR